MNKYYYPKRSYGLFCKLLGFFFLCLILGAMNIGAIGSLLRIIALLPVGLWLFSKHSIRLNKILKISIILIGWGLFSMMWTINLSASWDRIVTQISFLALLVSVSSYDYSNSDIGFLKNCLIWSSRITAFITLISADYINARVYLNGVVYEDPNYLCGYFMYGVVYCVEQLMSKGRFREKSIVIIELLIYIYIIFATGSRGGLLAEIVAVGGLFILLGNSDRRDIKTIIKRLAVVILLIGVYFITTYYLDRSVSSRFTWQSIIDSNGTGRFTMWENGIDAFRKSNVLRKFVGYGIGSVFNVTYMFPFERHNVLHNVYVDNLLEIGVIGLVIYILHIRSFLKTAWKKNNYFCLAILLGMITLSLSTSIHAFKPFWNIMLFTICISNRMYEASDKKGLF